MFPYPRFYICILVYKLDLFYMSQFTEKSLSEIPEQSEIPKIPFNLYACEAPQVSKRFRQKYYSYFMLTVLI